MSGALRQKTGVMCDVHYVRYVRYVHYVRGA